MKLLADIPHSDQTAPRKRQSGVFRYFFPEVIVKIFGLKITFFCRLFLMFNFASLCSFDRDSGTNMWLNGDSAERTE